jgi:hypothetical protein
MAGNKKLTQIVLSRVSDIPPKYLPEKGVFLDEPEVTHDGLYTVLLDGSWEPSDISTLPKNFEEAYSFLIAHRQMQVPFLKDFPWHGGSSSLHFDGWVKKTIPSKSRLGLSKLMIASPGFIRFTADDEIAQWVSQCVLNIIQGQARQIYNELSAYISKNVPKPNDSPAPASPDWGKINVELTKFTGELCEAIGAVDADLLRASVKSDYEAAQIVRWFYRRLRRIAVLHEDGRIQFTI